MMNSINILLIIFFISCVIIYNTAYKKGRKKGSEENYQRGYKNGIIHVEDEIRECCKLPDKEILKRVKNIWLKIFFF